MKSYISAIIILFLSGCTVTRKIDIFVRSYSPTIQKKYLIFNDGQTSLYYQTSFKQNSNSAPILFIVGGSGHFSSIYTLASFRHALKIVGGDVFILQKRQVRNREAEMRKPGKSFLKDYYFTQMVTDQEEFIKTILSKSENKGRKVILLGVSEGVTIAAKVAADLPVIRYLAIIGGGGMLQADELKLSYPSQKDNLERLFAAIKMNPNSLDKMTMGYTYKYWSDILFVDPMQYFLKLDIPILLGNGEVDRNAPIESARHIRTVFKEHHKTNLTYIEYAGCDHSLRDTSGRSYFPAFISKLKEMIER